MWAGLVWVVLLLVLLGVTFVIRVITAQMGMKVPRWIHPHAWLHLHVISWDFWLECLVLLPMFLFS